MTKGNGNRNNGHKKSRPRESCSPKDDDIKNFIKKSKTKNCSQGSEGRLEGKEGANSRVLSKINPVVASQSDREGGEGSGSTKESDSDNSMEWQEVISPSKEAGNKNQKWGFMTDLLIRGENIPIQSTSEEIVVSMADGTGGNPAVETDRDSDRSTRLPRIQRSSLVNSPLLCSDSPSNNNSKGASGSLKNLEKDEDVIGGKDVGIPRSVDEHFSIRVERLLDQQKNNRYKSSNNFPYVVNIESKEDSNNLGNIHPVSIGKKLFEANLNNIDKIRKIGRKIVEISFKNYSDANDCVTNQVLNRNNWITCIPSHKVRRYGVIRGLNNDISVDEITRCIKLCNSNTEIGSIERIKIWNRKNESLEDSSSIKIEFLSDLLPETASIYWVRFRITPFVYRVRRCFKCLRWGHSQFNCRGTEREEKRIPEQGSDRNNVTDNQMTGVVECIDCGGGHRSSDTACLIFKKFKIINTVMAYGNTNHFNAKKIIKSKNMKEIQEVESKCKSLAYEGGTTDFVITNNKHKNNKINKDVHKMQKVLRKENKNEKIGLFLDNSKVDKVFQSKEGEVYSDPGVLRGECLETDMNKTLTPGLGGGASSYKHISRYKLGMESKEISMGSERSRLI
jgi:hypothetical protein